MKYNFADRINRVINNHQFTCEHRSHYLFVLKGFDPVMAKLNLDLEAYDFRHIAMKANMFVTYEEAFLFETDVWSSLSSANYDIWIVDFNWFEGVYASTKLTSAYLTSTQEDNHYWVSYKNIDHLTLRKTITIFNTINPLIGIVTDLERLNSNSKRYDYLMQEKDS